MTDEELILELARLAGEAMVVYTNWEKQSAYCVAGTPEWHQCREKMIAAQAKYQTVHQVLAIVRAYSEAKSRRN